MIEVTPIKQRDAFAFIAEHHRHHNVPAGALFCVAVSDSDGVVRGVAVVGRPIAHKIDDGLTVEVTRLATDGFYNACSKLYAAARAVAVAKGYRRGVTYTLESERGSSLKAANWDYYGTTSGGSHDRPSRPRTDPNPTCPKHRWGFGQWHWEKMS